MKMKHYNARWGHAGSPNLGNVSFQSSHDHNAIKQADKIGKQLGLDNSHRTIYEGSRLVHPK